MNNKSILLLLFLTICGLNPLLAQVQIRSSTDKATVTALKDKILVFVLQEEKPERITKLEKKDPLTVAIYKQCIQTYNESVKKHAVLLKEYYKEVKCLTEADILNINEADLSSYNFAASYYNINYDVDFGYHEGTAYDFYSKKGVTYTLNLLKTISDYSKLCKEGKFEHKMKNYYQFCIYSLVENKKKKKVPGTIMILNYPFTCDILSEVDLFYVIKSCKSGFDQILADKSAGFPSDEDNLLKSKTLIVCETNIAPDFDKEPLKAMYKGKIQIVNKAAYDKKILEGSDQELILVVVPTMALPGVGQSGSNVMHGQIIVDSKTLSCIKSYQSKLAMNSTFGGGSVKGNYEYISEKRVEEYNEAFK